MSSFETSPGKSFPGSFLSMTTIELHAATKRFGIQKRIWRHADGLQPVDQQLRDDHPAIRAWGNKFYDGLLVAGESNTPSWARGTFLPAYVATYGLMREGYRIRKLEIPGKGMAPDEFGLVKNGINTETFFSELEERQAKLEEIYPTIFFSVVMMMRRRSPGTMRLRSATEHAAYGVTEAVHAVSQMEYQTTNAEIELFEADYAGMAGGV